MGERDCFWAALGAASAAAGLLTAGGALAQDAAPQPAAPGTPSVSEAEGDRVVVRGRRMSDVGEELEEVVSAFVGEVAAPPFDAGYARWQRSVCVGVYNVEADAAQYIADRISGLALEVGLNPGDPGCQPDVLVAFTHDARQFAAQLAEEQPRLFRPAGGTPYMQRGVEALEEFVASDAPVRWWNVSVPVSASTGQRAIRLPTDEYDPFEPFKNATVRMGGGGGSRIYSEVRDDMMYSLVIVDATKVSGAVSWEALADYLALVALAQVDPEADTMRYDSILNLFDNPEAYSGLTDWDRSFVHALYSFNQRTTVRMQPVMLVNEMTRNAEVFANLPVE